MLTSRPITAIVHVTNLERAKRFYTNNLGLRPKNENPTPRSFVLKTANADLELLETSEESITENTALSFEVDDLEREMKGLRARGIEFEDYDMPDLKTQNQIAGADGWRAAWFKDSEGNILCLHQKH